MVSLVESCDSNSDSDSDTFDYHKIERLRRDKFLIVTFVLITCIKVLLIPTYHSTDFEVHRNWLAITHTLPIHEWYTSEKSQWTLDYPPFFAWFEYALSKIGFLVDPKMTNIENLNYASNTTKLFQRATVIFADIVYAFGIREIGNTFCNDYDSFKMMSVLSLCNIGLLIVDHVHFQYNGFLLGILLLSISKVSRITKEYQVIQGALWFAVLLNFKHLYLYVAPAFGIWLLRSYCLKDNNFVMRVTKLGIIVMLISVLSFGPFINQISQVLSRLFPFKRGLVHAYWAANAWALYVAADKVLSVICKKIGWISNVKVASMTGGLVQEDVFTVLPTPTPLVTFIITFFFMIPALWSLFFNKRHYNDPKKFLSCIVICALSSFMFGWHVHEKAILTAIIPLSILAIIDGFDAKVFTILSSAGHIALFPLLYPDDLMPLKFILWSTYLITVVLLFGATYSSAMLNLHERFYVGFLPAITMYESIVHKMIFKDRLPFLPLALTSVYCAIGVSYSYFLYYHHYLFKDTTNSMQNPRKRNVSEISDLKCD